MAQKKKKTETADFLGLNKGSHDASICWIREENGTPQVQIFLKERLTRKKRDGRSIVPLAHKIKDLLNFDNHVPPMAETAVGPRPMLGFESNFNTHFPYFELMKKGGLHHFSAKYNSKLAFLPHHFSHALGSAAISPFEKSLILVSDGLGSFAQAFDANNPELVAFPAPKPQLENHQPGECLSVYLQNGLSLKCVVKNWSLNPIEEKYGPLDPEALGLFYQTCTDFVFGNGFEAGKLMGLAPFGKSKSVTSRTEFIQSFPKAQAFAKKPKRAKSTNWASALSQNIAATAQEHFEESIIEIIRGLKEKFPDYKNLILTGGTALNCVANTKIARLGLFEKIYVPPFPSDEGISFGLATWLQYRGRTSDWRPKPEDSPLEFWGPLGSVPKEAEIQRVFAGYKIERPNHLVDSVARLLQAGKILAWYQGRSECGPRALGHRSILADPSIPGLQKFLNQKVKFREDFRPYGASCTIDEAREYFELPQCAESPAMSFTANVYSHWRGRLSAVCHVDGSSRIQTLRKTQDPLFYDLLKSFGKRTGYSVLLNTSLNGPGEPIIETVEEAFRFFEKAPIHGAVVGPFVIHKM